MTIFIGNLRYAKELLRALLPPEHNFFTGPLAFFTNVTLNIAPRPGAVGTAGRRETSAECSSALNRRTSTAWFEMNKASKPHDRDGWRL